MASCAERPSEADLEFVGRSDSQLYEGMSIEALNVLLEEHIPNWIYGM